VGFDGTCIFCVRIECVAIQGVVMPKIAEYLLFCLFMPLE